jgi:hypothetical protein
VEGVEVDLGVEEGDLVEVGEVEKRVLPMRLSKLELWLMNASQSWFASGPCQIRFPTSTPVYIWRTSVKSARWTKFSEKLMKSTLLSRWIRVLWQNHFKPTI